MDRLLIRDARIHDMRQIVRLAERLIRYEASVGLPELIEDADTRYNIMYTEIGKCLVNPDCKVMVIEKAGRVHGFFVLRIKHKLPIFKHYKYCEVWLGYNSKKSPVSIMRIDMVAREWAKSKGCSLMTMVIVEGNQRACTLAEKSGFQHRFNVMEREVQL